MNLETLKHLNRDDLLDMFGLETRRPATDYVLPALAVFGVGVAVGTGLGLLVAQRSGKELRESIATTIQGAPEALTSIPGRVSHALHKATDTVIDAPTDTNGR